MRAVIQRVSQASVTVKGEVISKIGKGLLVLLGITDEDQNEDILWLAKKVAHLRIFNDDDGIMNRSVMEENGEVIVVSQFTLYAGTKKGNRPSYMKASKPEVAVPLYESFVNALEKELGKHVGTGVFGAEMKVELLNDGPVTIIVDTKNKE